MQEQRARDGSDCLNNVVAALKLVSQLNRVD